MKASELIAALEAAAAGEPVPEEGRALLSRIARVMARTKTWELDFVFATLSKLKPAPLPPRGAAWYSRRLADTYNHDGEFEQLVAEMRTDRSINRTDAIELYHSLFESDRDFAAKFTKPKIVDEIRRERLARVRFR